MALEHDKAVEASKVRRITVGRMPSFIASLYSFFYRSKNGTDSNPLVLLARNFKSGSYIFTAGNGQRYMVGVNLNYASEGVRQLLIDKFGSLPPQPYSTLQVIGDIASQAFRVYDVRKLRDLSVVSATKYLQETDYEEEKAEDKAGLYWV